MTVETERMNITIQKELAVELKKITTRRKRSQFINKEKETVPIDEAIMIHLSLK